MAGLGFSRPRRANGGTLRPFALLTVLSITLLFVRNADPIRAAASVGTQALAPVEHVIANVGRGMNQFFQAIGEIERLRGDNARLRDQADQLTLENVRLREDAFAAQQAARLGAAQATVPSATIEAAVIARDPSAILRTIVLDRGTEVGVQTGNVVIADRGVVGRVREVGAGYAKVLLVTDSSSVVSALVQGSRATGIVRGQYGDTLVMDWILQTEPVNSGDVVLTAGLGLGEELRSLYPKGLVLGTVVDVSRSDVSAYLRAVIAPAVDLRTLERVLVVSGAAR